MKQHQKISSKHVIVEQKSCVIIFLLCFSLTLFSQKNYNKLSIETSYGFNIPIKPKEDIRIVDYTIPRHFDIGVRYMFNELLGLKIDYSNDRFQDIRNNNTGNSYNRLSLKAVFNITNKLNLIHNKNYKILLHAGLGITHAYPESIKRFRNGGEFSFGLTPNITKDFERIGNVIFGVKPQYKCSDNFAIYINFTSVINIEQQYSYSGELLNIDMEKVRGRFVNFSFGIQFYLGKNRRHSDWYNSSGKWW